ncbi:hypothetical protein [Polynucleobacter sp.]
MINLQSPEQQMFLHPLIAALNNSNLANAETSGNTAGASDRP